MASLTQKNRELTLTRGQFIESPYKKTLHFNSADGMLQFVAKLWLYNKHRDLCPLDRRVSVSLISSAWAGEEEVSPKESRRDVKYDAASRYV